jgi:hypothetical protein
MPVKRTLEYGDERNHILESGPRWQTLLDRVRENSERIALLEANYMKRTEIEGRFASKADLAAENDSISTRFNARIDLANARVDAMQEKFGNVVPRGEHELRWQLDTQRYADLEHKLDEYQKEQRANLKATEFELKGEIHGVAKSTDAKIAEIALSVESLRGDKLPPWFLPTCAVLVALISPLVTVLLMSLFHSKGMF